MELVVVEQFAGEFAALGSKGWYHVIALADRIKHTSTIFLNCLSRLDASTARFLTRYNVALLRSTLGPILYVLLTQQAHLIFCF
jgi:hypothetical protein